MNLALEAQGLLLYQFKNSPKLKGLLNNLIKPLDDVLEEINQLYNGRYIDKAYGERLETIGRIVNQPRKNMDDEAYKAWLKVRIRLNIGHGRAEDVLGILNILNCTVLLKEYQPNIIEIAFIEEPKVYLKSLFGIVKAACPVASKNLFKRAFLSPIFRFDISFGPMAEFYQENI